MEFKRVIEVTKETRDFLQQAFDVTGTMVWYALNFDEKRGQSDLAKRIRSLALQKGGVVLNIGPEVETIHSADGRMRQYFHTMFYWRLTHVAQDRWLYIRKANFSVFGITQV